MTTEGALAAQSRSRALLTERTTSMVLAAWRTLPDYNRGSIDAFLGRVLPAVYAGQGTTASVTSTYIAAVISAELGEVVAPVPPGDVRTLRGVPAEEVYTRPFVEVWTALKKGQSFDGAVSVGADRLSRLVEDDLSLAHRRAALVSISSDDRVTGFRRVVRPEMSRSGSCGLCGAASTQIYRTDQLLPIHTRCNCDVMPILDTGSGTRDPGARLNDADLESLYREAESTNGRELKKVRFAIHEHGELGPVLREAGDDFTGPSDIAA